MNCLYPFKLTFKNIDLFTKPWSRYSNGDKVVLPCGHCVACMQNKVNAWTYRICAELQFYDKVSFITLTFDDEHLPENGSNDTRQYQLFWKRLRKFYKGRKIFYFGCTEYGSSYGRCHAHFIVGGLDIEDFLCPELDLVSHNSKNGKSPFWSNGLISFGLDVSCYNVALVRYVTKYVFKTDVKTMNAFCDIMEIERPKLLFSKGIGSRFMEQYKDCRELPSLNRLKYFPSPYWKKKYDIGYDFSPQRIKEMKHKNNTRAIRSTGLEVTDSKYSEIVTEFFNKKEGLYD